MLSPAIRLLGSIAAATAGVLVAGWLLLVVMPPILVGTHGLGVKDQIDAENDARGILVQAIGGVVLVVGLAFTARSYLVSREGLVTDRYTAAVNQLGDDHLPVRLGGIYALERIARDSARDRATILEILAAIVRETTRPMAAERPPSEVIAALEAISRLPGHERPRDIDLRGVDLTGLRLPGLAIAGADLTNARLERAVLPGADLRGATLDYIKAPRVRLSDADLGGARGTQPGFGSAYLDRAVLADASFETADFTTALMAGIDARRTVLRGAVLKLAQLATEDLGHPTRFDNADLTNAIMTDADLSGLDLRTVRGLTSDQAKSAHSDDQTRWPSGLV